MFLAADPIDMEFSTKKELPQDDGSLLCISLGEL
jgi:hypothetical protein